MQRLAKFIVDRVLNGGGALVFMGVQWLYLWTFPWFADYEADPRWGHNYVLSMAFLTVGLAYFNRRLLSSGFAFLAALLVIPTSLEIMPMSLEISMPMAFLVLVVLDILLEWNRTRELVLSEGAISWLDRNLLPLSYVMLAGISIIYFAVRVPSGTYETDIDTVVFDILLLPFVLLLLLERVKKGAYERLLRLASFFYGMATMIVLLVMLYDQPETHFNLYLTSGVLVLSIVAVAIARPGKSEPL